MTGLLGSSISAKYSLIGSNAGSGLAPAPVGFPDANGNLIGGGGVFTSITFIDPLLGPLADNGGFTLPDGSHILTHALLPGSPAINAGDPSAVAGSNGVPEFDQRGVPFARVHGGRIDIGAVEYQPNPQPGDYNRNGEVDAADYVMWRNTFRSASDIRADSNEDGEVDKADYAFWRANFGNTSTSPPIAMSSAAVTTTPALVVAEVQSRISPPRRPALVASHRGDFRPSVSERALLAVATSDSAGNRGILESLSRGVATVARGQYSPRVRDGIDSLDEAFAALGFADG